MWCAISRRVWSRSSCAWPLPIFSEDTTICSFAHFDLGCLFFSVESQDFFIFGHYRIHEFRHFLPPCRLFPPFSVVVLIHKRLPSSQCFHSFTTVTAALDNFSLWYYEPLATKHSNQVSIAGFVTSIINVIKMPFNILYWVIQASGVSSFLWAVPYGLGALWVYCLNLELFSFFGPLLMEALCVLLQGGFSNKGFSLALVMCLGHCYCWTNLLRLPLD